MQKKSLLKTCRHLFFHIRPTKKLTLKQSTILKHLILWKMARIQKKHHLSSIGISSTLKSWQRSSSVPKAAFLNIRRVQKNEQKESDYFSQFTTRQTLSSFYGNIQKKQLNTLVRFSFQRKGHAGHRLISLLESRLDLILYRASFCTSIFAARQLISHGKILVNGNISTNSSLILIPGDVVSISEKEQDAMKSKIRSISKKAIKKPSHLEIDYKLMTLVYLYTPTYVFFPTFLQRDELIKSFS